MTTSLTKSLLYSENSNDVENNQQYLLLFGSVGQNTKRNINLIHFFAVLRKKIWMNKISKSIYCTS